MAETLLSFGVEKLWDLLVRESGRFQGVEEQFNGLKSDLKMLRCFLKDADAKKHTVEMVKNTVDEIKEIVYDAEDIIETFLLKEEQGKTSGIRKIVRKLSSVIVDRRKLASDIRAISMRISKVIRDMQSLGVQQVIVSDGYAQSLQERQREMRQTFSYDNESNLVGLEENVKKLVGHLVGEDSSSQVVSITGMGGIGKTTLARQVFNHEIVKGHFEILAWVCVSQQFARKHVWQTILRKFRPEYVTSKMTEDELQEKLFRVMETQKALIVLDDIWREEDWDRIKPMFPREKGWKVLLTSRNEGVALRADPKCFIFKPDYLTLQDSWTLFQMIAFPREENITEYKVDEELKEIGKQMIKHCGGLPLAVKVLGGLLVAQYTSHDWERVYENIRSHIVGGTSFNERNISSVYHILYLSFEELPVYLKHCFLYLAHFPEDYAIDVEKLSYYWASEGITRQRYYDSLTIREVADGYIENLVKRNLVISERDAGTSRFETCHLHDMMREVCLLKAEEENFLKIVPIRSPPNTSASSMGDVESRRLAVNWLHTTDQQVVAEMTNPKIRSLLFINQFDWEKRNLFFTRLQLMRVLDLSRARFEGERLPSSIGELIHLKYLSLYMAHVRHLPSSMQNLKLLLYLNLCVHEDCPLYVPNIFKEMQELTYLLLPLWINVKVKLELSTLVNLETLQNFSTERGSVRDLQGLTRLRTLSIYIRGGCTVETLSSSLSNLRRLEKLTIHHYRMYAPTNDKKGFVFDCAYLKQLELRIYMPRLPDEQHFPSNLRTVSLTESCLKEDPMPILGMLFHLKEVSLLNKSFLGRKMVCSSNRFPQLRKLYLRTLEDWEEWIVQEGSMPQLHTLTISNCQKLKEISDGFRSISSLEELSIMNSGREFEKKFSRGGEDYYKVQHIPALKFC